MNRELIYFLSGIFAIYGLAITIMCYRAIRSVTAKYREQVTKERSEDVKQMESLLAQAYRILNNHEHKA